jgi:hypothetical protein
MGTDFTRMVWMVHEVIREIRGSVSRNVGQKLSFDLSENSADVCD